MVSIWMGSPPRVAARVLARDRVRLAMMISLNPVAQQVHGGQLGHFARTDQHGLGGFEVAEDLARQFNGCVADGHRA